MSDNALVALETTAHDGLVTLLITIVCEMCWINKPALASTFRFIRPENPVSQGLVFLIYFIVNALSATVYTDCNKIRIFFVIDVLIRLLV